MTSPDDFDWVRHEAELTGGPPPVDTPDALTPHRWSAAGLRATKRRPIIPAWARSRTELMIQVRWVVAYYTHVSLYHLTRSPKYAAKLVIRAPRGAARLVGGAVRWVVDAEGAPVRAAAVRRESAEEYLKLSRQRDARVRLRTALLVSFLVGGIAAAGLLVIAGSEAAWYAVLIAVVAVLGVAGTPADRPLVDAAVSATRTPKLTSDVVLTALGALGVAGINQAISRRGLQDAIRFAEPISRDGPGWRAVLDLPPGVTVDQVVEKRKELASALSRPLGCVWPEGNVEVHPGRLVLWVGDDDLSKAEQPGWPLLKSGTASLFRPVPFGTDQRGRPVMVTLMFASMVIGSIPRVGKTVAARLLLLAGALDVLAEIHAYDLKGMGDLAPVEPVCHRYRAGSDDDDVAYGLADMREVAAELTRRARVLRELPRELCPESKITPELAARAAYRLHPILIVVDECQRWFEHSEHGEELREIAEDLVRRGPAAGIIAVFATQRPDAKSLPTGISGNAVLRFCLKVMGQMENDMVLGTSAYRNGVRATMFSRRDLGIGYLAGEGDEPQITRTYNVDGPAAEGVVRRARVLREEAGRITGHALGEEFAPHAVAAVSVLDDIAAVVLSDETKVWCETVAARLAELRPETYAGWDGEQVTVALKPYRVKVRQVWGTDRSSGLGANRRGFERVQLLAAIAERNRRRDAG
ncbi:MULTISPECIES: cell division protein FtsK [Catenuloplanes]|uniref:S-DNA-T family DNA segregation ATPase FtsK/SpoIIIE n=1 Tax=Catenuloplanes niger TaxID=587534 RepID=A0AAE3ZR71_9ACTN|nr:cell division protein FtsK [Catenuloplanes niger]MDR7323285.1 S-DNA-T family DNA segregation ATPase FtsK/SpoIIIE [Catenuloplanes niger]